MRASKFDFRSYGGSCRRARRKKRSITLPTYFLSSQTRCKTPPNANWIFGSPANGVAVRWSWRVGGALDEGRACVGCQRCVLGKYTLCWLCSRMLTFYFLSVHWKFDFWASGERCRPVRGKYCPRCEELIYSPTSCSSDAQIRFLSVPRTVSRYAG